MDNDLCMLSALIKYLSLRKDGLKILSKIL